jgi:hypothetical protein
MLREQVRRLLRRTGRSEPVDPARFADPLALEVDWGPARAGGNNDRTHRLVTVSPTRLEIRPGPGAFVAGLVLCLVGAGAIVVASPGALLSGAAPLVSYRIVSLLVALICVPGGLFALYSGSVPAVLDRQEGCFWKGWRKPDAASAMTASRTRCTLESIHALQVVAERCGDDIRPYYSYELNLVLRNGTRINLLDHNDLDGLRRDAGAIAVFLTKPVWDATLPTAQAPFHQYPWDYR